jgi:phage terminase small subunit
MQVKGNIPIKITTPTPPAPSTLGGHGRKLWRSVLGAYLLTPAEHEVLIALCHATDQLEKLNAELVSAPLTVKGSRGQQVPNPLLAEARSHARTVETLQRSLCLPVPGEKKGAWRDPHASASINERWRRTRTVKDREA